MSTYYLAFVLQNSTFDVTNERQLRAIFCSEYGIWMGRECRSDWVESLPAQRKIFYGPHNNFTAGVATHVAESLGITQKGELFGIITPSINQSVKFVNRVYSYFIFL